MRLPIFSGPKLKVERAKRHLSELQTDWEAFLASNPHKVRIFADSESKAIQFQGFHQAPAYFNCIIGDAIHNLRSSLDLLINDLAARNGIDTFKHRFPFFKERAGNDGFESSGSVKAVKKSLSASDFSAIEKLQPYNGGKLPSALRGLHELDITDKHQTIIAHVAQTIVRNIRITSASGKLIQSIGQFTLEQGPLWGRGPDHIVIMGAPDNIKVEYETDPSAQIVFEKGQPFEGQSIIPTLAQLIELTAGVISSFE